MNNLNVSDCLHHRGIQLLSGFLFLIFTSGCASIGARQAGSSGKPFIGVRENIYYLAHPGEADYPFLQPLNIVDLPFSAVLDTVLLPVDLARLQRKAEPDVGDNPINAPGVER